MKFSNIVLAASATGLVSSYPHGREVIPGKRALKKRSSGFTCKSTPGRKSFWVRNIFG